MKFTGALIKEQGVRFGIIAVKPYVLNNSDASNSIQMFGHQLFGNVPIVLMAKNARGIPTYWGRKDIVNFLSGVPIELIPWREYTVN